MRFNHFVFYLLVLSLISSCSNHPTVVVLHHKYYTSTFDCSKHIPILVEFTLTKQMVSCSSHFHRRARFTPDPELPSETNIDRDYVRSGYDRGHNMSAEDNACEEDGMEQCFYLSNVYPQKHKLNAGIWEDLEHHEREEAYYNDSIRVFIGSIGQIGTIGNDGIAVPEYCWKVIYIYKTNKYQCYKMPNTDDIDDSAKYYSYKIDLNELEKESGVQITNNHAVLESRS